MRCSNGRGFHDLIWQYMTHIDILRCHSSGFHDASCLSQSLPLSLLHFAAVSRHRVAQWRLVEIADTKPKSTSGHFLSPCSRAIHHPPSLDSWEWRQRWSLRTWELYLDGLSLAGNHPKIHNLMAKCGKVMQNRANIYANHGRQPTSYINVNLPIVFACFFQCFSMFPWFPVQSRMGSRKWRAQPPDPSEPKNSPRPMGLPSQVWALPPWVSCDQIWSCHLVETRCTAMWSSMLSFFMFFPCFFPFGFAQGLIAMWLAGDFNGFHRISAYAGNAGWTFTE